MNETRSGFAGGQAGQGGQGGQGAQGGHLNPAPHPSPQPHPAPQPSAPRPAIPSPATLSPAIPSPAIPSPRTQELRQHGGIPPALQRHVTPVEEPLELVEDAPIEQAKSKIHGLSVGPTHAAQEYKRGTHKNQTGAVRVRSFHCRLSEQGLEFMDHAINDWLDRHPDIEIKFTSSTVGPFDGKIKEPALILNVWY